MEVEALAGLRELVDAGALAFARIGACVMLLPGIGGARVAMRMRLAFAILLAAVSAPLVGPVALSGTPLVLAASVGSEVAFGAVLGLVARLHLEAMRFAGSVIAGLVGFNPLGGTVIDGAEADGALSALVAMGALMAIFVFGLHHDVLRALIDTFRTAPVGTPFEPRSTLVLLTDAVTAAFAVALALCGPFVVYGLVGQMLLGLVNKLAPTIPLYFIGMPALIAGGLVMLALAMPQLLAVHVEGFGTILDAAR